MEIFLTSYNNPRASIIIIEIDNGKNEDMVTLRNSDNNEVFSLHPKNVLLILKNAELSNRHANNRIYRISI